MGLFDALFGSNDTGLKDALSKGGTIVDVRTESEYVSGHVVGSINIPLSAVADHVDDFRDMAKPLILICRSGNRSGSATTFLKSKGVQDVMNGGAWTTVKKVLGHK